MTEDKKHTLMTGSEPVYKDTQINEMSNPVDNAINAVNSTYDSVFRTLLNDCSRLIIPLINDAFNQHFTDDAVISFDRNEFFAEKQDGKESEIITDTNFIISEKETVKKYHWECQSSNDSSILIRLFGYDSQIALRDNIVTDTSLIVTFPESAVLFLRSNRNTPKKLTQILKTPGGMVKWTIPTIEVRNYSIDEIFKNMLYFLIPFYIFNHEKSFEKNKDSQEFIDKLKFEYELIKQKLEELSLCEEISTYEKITLNEMTVRVLDAVAVKYTNIVKGVESVMSGKILDYEAKRILNKGRNEGHNEGLIEGKIISIKNLMDTFKLNAEQAMNALKIPENEQTELMKMIVSGK